MRIMIALLALLLAAAAPGALAAESKGTRFYEGLSAYNAGEFERAARVWAPLAAAGNGNAQSGLGLLYYSGVGVPRDFDRARRLFVRAAEQGVVQAQMFLGLMYMHGDGVRRDYRLAYMWTDIAVANGDESAIDLRNLIQEHLNAAEIGEAADLAADWRHRHADR